MSIFSTQLGLFITDKRFDINKFKNFLKEYHEYRPDKDVFVYDFILKKYGKRALEFIKELRNKELEGGGAECLILF
jgi:hypothetical protein